MIVTQDDIAGLKRTIEEITTYYATPEDQEADFVPQDPVFIANHPHLVMLLGFDEFRALDGYHVTIEEEERVKRLYGLNNYVPAFDYESLYRNTKSGAWYWYEGMTPMSVNLQGPPSEPHRSFSIDEWITLLQKTCDQPDNTKRTLWLPGVWTPRVQKKQEILLTDSVSDLLAAVINEHKDIREIPWRQLEEIVAELLRARGLQVSVTPRSADGGRDIIARGELIPGEPMLLAVEVKQKPVVGIGDVQRALRANEDFPALMVATAGRFSAGVINEKQRSRNNLRLFLKDGVALTQWINAYKWTEIL